MGPRSILDNGRVVTKKIPRQTHFIVRPVAPLLDDAKAPVRAAGCGYRFIYSYLLKSPR